jgi:hypothetical protein
MNALDNVIVLAGDLQAHNFEEMQGYWDAHLQLINGFHEKYGANMIVVIEDYVLYAHKADSQINSHMETSKMIGLLQHYCWEKGIPYKMQLAASVKKRWDNSILLYKRYIVHHRNQLVLPINNKKVHKHCIDAIRHAVHYATFENVRSTNEQRTKKTADAGTCRRS